LLLQETLGDLAGDAQGLKSLAEMPPFLCPIGRSLETLKARNLTGETPPIQCDSAWPSRGTGTVAHFVDAVGAVIIAALRIGWSEQLCMCGDHAGSSVSSAINMFVSPTIRKDKGTSSKR
jgi:hypothetical protein